MCCVVWWVGVLVCGVVGCFVWSCCGVLCGVLCVGCGGLLCWVVWIVVSLNANARTTLIEKKEQTMYAKIVLLHSGLWVLSVFFWGGAWQIHVWCEVFCLFLEGLVAICFCVVSI